jgi:hypothetical protein
MERSVILAVSAALGGLVLVLELVRRRKLREDYSLLWLFTALVMVVVAAWRDLLHGLAAFVGIAYPPNLLFLLAALFIICLLLYFSVVITRLTQESKQMAQELALLRHELERLRVEHQQADRQQDPQTDHISP